MIGLLVIPAVILIWLAICAFIELFLPNEERVILHRKRPRRTKRQQPQSPMQLYVASGKVPTGRTAEILFEAERGYQRRNDPDEDQAIDQPQQQRRRST
jgi:hypothetical protein